MVAYMPIAEFLALRRIDASSLPTALEQAELDTIRRYLYIASNHTRQMTRRDFLPHRAVRGYPLPARFSDLQMRRYPSATLILDDADLLDVVEIRLGASWDDGAPLPADAYDILPHNLYPKWGLSPRGNYRWDSLSAAGLNTATIWINGVWGFHNDITTAWVDTLFRCDAVNATSQMITLLPRTDYAPTRDVFGRLSFLEGDLIRIEDEYCEVLLWDEELPLTLTVRRAQNGTTASAHTASAPIYRWQVVPQIQQAVYMIAKSWREHDTATGGRIGVSDMSTGAELGIPNDALRILNVYRRLV